MRTLSALALLTGLAAAAPADEKKKDEPKSGPSLKVGDPAPPLKASKWLQGAEVKEFAPGKVYVVEFWATWCGPCIVMMPHLGELQAEFKDRGVTVVGFSAGDPNNTAEKVGAFVGKRGPKLGYTFAFADDRGTYDAYMKAAGQGGIPCAYVVDRAGKVAYVGHPMFLDVVLPKVVSGEWKGADGAAEVAKVEKDADAAFEALGNDDAAAGLKAFGAFAARYPKLAAVPYFTGPRLGLLVKAKKTAEAKELAEAVIAKAVRQEDPTALRSVAGALRSPAARASADLAGLGLKAAEAGLAVAGEKDVPALMGVAEAHFAAGDKAKAREYGAKAVAAADTPQMKTAIERAVKKYEDEKKEKKKDDKE